MSEGVPTGAGYSRSTGTVHALTLMVDFSDAPGPGNALDRFREFFPRTQQWFRTSSYGRLDYRPETPIPHWLRMPKTFRAYGIERGAPFDPGYRDLVQDIVAAADPEVDFRDVRLPERADDAERRAVRPGHGPVGDLRRKPGRPGRRRRPRRQRVLRLLPPGRRLRLLRPDRLPGAAARERPCLRPARPLHPGGRGRGRALGHHERGLGGQQRPARLAQVEARLAGRVPGQLRVGARRPRSTR